ncbi:MAG: CpsD/CapB family tyrosine-protein kinase [Syntrophorhabdaceae bacterium]|nr:CpsD/CapB family tyrosine-protein kinase [Syntrophorhabdaceae bacterium]
MSKIFEALEHAKQKLRHSKTVSTVTETSRLNMEYDMIQLYQMVSHAITQKGYKIFQIIGSVAREGASTISREFASTLAMRLGKNVLLLDADPEIPTHHQAFNINITRDMKSVIKGGTPIVEALYRVEDTSLFIAAMSVSDSYGADLFDSPRIDRVWEEFKRRFDIVIVDSPPGGASPIGFTICRTVDAVILVVEAEKTRWPVVLNVKERLLQNGANIIGVVFNKRKFYIPGWIYRRL